MGAVGDDIKQAFIEVGTRYNVQRNNTLVATGEYLLYDIDTTATLPFIREFYLTSDMPYDTAAQTGDVLTFDDGRAYFLVTKTPDQLENETIEHFGALYKINVSGELLRYSGETRNAQYQLVPQWQTIRTNAYGLLTSSKFGQELADTEVGQPVATLDVLYIPSSYGAQLLDRYVPVSGEYHRIAGIQRRVYPGIDVLNLEADSRD